MVTCSQSVPALDSTRITAGCRRHDVPSPIAACGCNRRGETLYGAGSVLFKSVGTYNVIGTRAVNTTSGVSSVTPTPRATLRVWRSLNR